MQFRERDFNCPHVLNVMGRTSLDRIELLAAAFGTCDARESIATIMLISVPCSPDFSHRDMISVEFLSFSQCSANVP
jgi:hypothetical protein